MPSHQSIMADSAFHNRNPCHQENAHHRQIRTHQSCQPTNRHNHRIEIPKIPGPQSRRLQGQSQPQPSAQHQRRPVRTCCRVLINAGRLRHYPITPQIPVNQVSATPLSRGSFTYFFLYPAGHFGFTPVTFFVNFPFTQVIVVEADDAEPVGLVPLGFCACALTITRLSLKSRTSY